MLISPQIERAFRLAVGILGNEADARDATQDALLDAWRGIGRLRDPERFDAWLGRILVNSCRSMGRRRGRAKVREIPITALSPGDDPPSPAASLEDEATRLDELERAFNRLPVTQRSLLALHHLDHRSVADLAVIQGIPEGTVKWRLHAAREALERSLAEERR
jgi:RNA polymerase sigma-70 factor (ECF subfamily)